MDKIDQLSARNTPRNGWKSGLGGAALLCLLAASTQAMVVSVDIGWGYGAGWGSDAAAQTGLQNVYNLQEGSIVQIIMYNSADYPSLVFTGGAPNQNFDNFGNYDGTGLDAEPYNPGGGGAHVPGDSTIYMPETTPAGHVIAYTTTIGDSINTGPLGTYWYNIYAQFEVLGTYDSLYVRVFGATNFPQGEVIASYWGLSTVQTNTGVIGTWYVPVGSLDNVQAPYRNYFEVIPEPGSMALFMLGGAGLLEGHRRRRKSVRGG
jgi:hypothetical protein